MAFSISRMLYDCCFTPVRASWLFRLSSLYRRYCGSLCYRGCTNRKHLWPLPFNSCFHFSLSTWVLYNNRFNRCLLHRQRTIVALFQPFWPFFGGALLSLLFLHLFGLLCFVVWSAFKTWFWFLEVEVLPFELSFPYWLRRRSNRRHLKKNI